MLARLPAVTSTRLSPHRRRSRHRLSQRAQRRAWPDFTTPFSGASTDGYLRSTVATAPEPNSPSRSRAWSTCFEPREQRGPWLRQLRCTTNCTHRSIPAPPTPAGASRLLPVLGLAPAEPERPFPDPAHEPVPIDPSRVLTRRTLPPDVRAKVPSNQPAPGRPATATLLHHSKSLCQTGGHRLDEIPTACRCFVREHRAMIAAPVQRR
jgi:hypothetical protein